MNVRHILSLAALALTLGLVLAGQATAKPGPLTSEQIVSQSSSSTPDLVQRWLQQQPASTYYTPAALKAAGLRMQAMARTYGRPSTYSATSSDSFDVRDALVGAAGGLGIALGAGALVFAVSRSRRPQVAV